MGSEMGFHGRRKVLPREVRTARSDPLAPASFSHRGRKSPTRVSEKAPEYHNAAPRQSQHVLRRGLRPA